MIGRITLAAALLIGTAAFAQQTPTQSPNSPNSPSTMPSTQNQNSTQCWDSATNQVRDRGTVGAGNQPGGARPNSPPNNPSTAPGSTANRPAGMTNC